MESKGARSVTMRRRGKGQQKPERWMVVFLDCTAVRGIQAAWKGNGVDGCNLDEHARPLVEVASKPGVCFSVTLRISNLINSISRFLMVYVCKYCG